MLGYGQARAGGESPHIGRRRALQLATAAALVAPRGVRAEEEAAEAVVEELGNKPIFLEGVEELAPPPLEAQVCGALIAAVKPWPAHSGLEDTAGVTTLPAGCAEAPAQPCFGMPQRSSTLSLCYQLPQRCSSLCLSVSLPLSLCSGVSLTWRGTSAGGTLQPAVMNALPSASFTVVPLPITTLTEPCSTNTTTMPTDPDNKKAVQISKTSPKAKQFI